MSEVFIFILLIPVSISVSVCMISIVLHVLESKKAERDQNGIQGNSQDN